MSVRFIASYIPLLYRKTGVYRVYIIFLFLHQNIDCRYLLEPPLWGGSNAYPQSMILS